MSRPLALLVVATSLVGVACSASDAAAPATPAPAPPPTAATTTTSDRTTTTATTSTSTTTTTSTNAPTTDAPTTTVDPITEIEAAVKQARLDAEAAYFAAAADPSNEELREEFRSFFTESFFVSNEDFLDGLVADGARLRASADVPTTLTFLTPIELPGGASSMSAVVRVCRVDSDVIYLPSEAGVSNEIIVNDEVITTLTSTQLSLVEGRWILADGATVERWTGVHLCDA